MLAVLSDRLPSQLAGTTTCGGDSGGPLLLTQGALVIWLLFEATHWLVLFIITSNRTAWYVCLRNLTKASSQACVSASQTRSQQTTFRWASHRLGRRFPVAARMRAPFVLPVWHRNISTILRMLHLNTYGCCRDPAARANHNHGSFADDS